MQPLQALYTLVSWTAGLTITHSTGSDELTRAYTQYNDNIGNHALLAAGKSRGFQLPAAQHHGLAGSGVAAQRLPYAYNDE